VTDVIAQVLERDPDWRALPSDTPPHVRRLLQRCLEKDRQRRMRDCGDVVRDLTDPVIEAPTSPKPAGTIPLVMGGIACAALGAAVVLAAGAIRSSSVEAPQRLVQLALITGGEQLVNGQSGRLPLAISQDGRRVVYSSNRQLYVRSLNALVPLPIAGTEAIATPVGERGSTGFAMQPILSPDGESVAYRQGADLNEWRWPGGAASVICACAADYGATWAHDDTILFGLRGKDSGVWRVPANGGTPVLVAREDVGTIVLRPQLST
jgi:hypothetical protein